jgi:hypothetical protein
LPVLDPGDKAVEGVPAKATIYVDFDVVSVCSKAKIK